MALIAVAWLLSIVIRFALSRKREYLADAGSVELTKNPDAMITALRKIEGRGELEGATSAVMEMCVDNPRSGFADLFATHPPIESRIEAIIEVRRRPRPRPAGIAGARGADGRGADESMGQPAPTGPWGGSASRNPPATSRSCRRGRRSSSAVTAPGASEPGPVGTASQELTDIAYRGGPANPLPASRTQAL